MYSYEYEPIPNKLDFDEFTKERDETIKINNAYFDEALTDLINESLEYGE